MKENLDYQFHLIRDCGNEKGTLGTTFRKDGSKLGYVLEDPIRAPGIKIPGKTAIPQTHGLDYYFMEIRMSPRFGEAVVIYTHKEHTAKEGDKYYLRAEGIEFLFILCHGGNSHEDTDGCLLVNLTRSIINMTAQGSMQKQYVAEVKKYLDQGIIPRLKITNQLV